MAKARIEDLFNLHNQLVKSMGDVDSMINEVDGKANAALEEWTSKGRDEFEEAWNQLKGPGGPLVRLCQVFASAASDVGYQHNHFALGAKEEHHPHLPENVQSPR